MTGAEHTLRVGLVIPYWTAWGGTAAVARDLVEHAAPEGVAFDVFTTDVDEGGRLAESPPAPAGVTVHVYRNVSSRLARRSRAFLPPAYFRSFARRVREFDVVQVIDHRHLLGSWAIRRAHRVGVPTILSPHASLPNQESRTRYKAVYDRLLAGRELTLVSHLHALSDSEAAVMTELGISADRISVIPNGIRLPDQPPATERLEAKDAMGLPHDVPTLLYLGRLVRGKRIRELLTAFRDLLEDGLEARMLIAGADDGEEPWVRSFIEQESLGDRVMYLGFVEGAAKERAFHAADGFALWSEREGQPMAVLEALSHGLPVHVTAPAAPDGLEAAGIGTVVRDVDEPLAAASSLHAFLTGIGPARVDAARQFVAERFSWADVARRYVEMFRRVSSA